MDTDGAGRGSAGAPWLGRIGAILVVASLYPIYYGVGTGVLTSSWTYCGERTHSTAVPCRCPEADIEATWPGDAVICFSRAPESAYLAADLGAGGVVVGSFLLLVAALLRRDAVRRSIRLITSALKVVAGLVLASLAAVAAAPVPCLDCPSSPSDPGLRVAAVMTGTAAVLLLGTALIPLGRRISGGLHPGPGPRL